MATPNEIAYTMAGDYNENCRPQLAAIQSTIPYILDGINVLDVSSSSFVIADFGAAHGQNSMHTMKLIIDHLKQTKKIVDEKQVLVVHNDLAGNDWTTLFDLLNKDQSYHGVANGRSFYESCLPADSLAIGYSSTSLHWLSKKPCNLSNHCSSVFAQGPERKAFEDQARLDWTHFLEHRSRELMTGGVLVLLIPAVDDQGRMGFDILREFLYRCAQSLLTPQELLDYTLPIYARRHSECVDEELLTRSSLQLVKADFGSVPVPFIKQWQDAQLTMDQFAQSLTAYIRSWSEPTLKQALGMNNRSEDDVKQLLNQFWTLYDREIRKQPDQLLDIHANVIYLILKKR